mgnify:CR=1 FL=1
MFNNSKLLVAFRTHKTFPASSSCDHVKLALTFVARSYVDVVVFVMAAAAAAAVQNPD